MQYPSLIIIVSLPDFWGGFFVGRVPFLRFPSGVGSLRPLQFLGYRRSLRSRRCPAGFPLPSLTREIFRFIIWDLRSKTFHSLTSY